LDEYSNNDIVLPLPDGQDVSSIEILYVKSRNSKDEKVFKAQILWPSFIKKKSSHSQNIMFSILMSAISNMSLFSQDVYGLVKFYSDLSVPKEREIGKFTGINYDLSDNVIIKDAKTLFIPQFYFVYEALQAFFFVGKGLDRTNPVIKVTDHRGR
jgi:hypothetical protein